MGIKPPALQEFYRSLRARGETTDTLAGRFGLSGGVVRRVIGGFRKKPAWWPAFVALCLTEKEAQLLAQVEQCTTWNSERNPRKLKWPGRRLCFSESNHKQ